MKLFRKFLRPPLPPIVQESRESLDPEATAADQVRVHVAVQEAEAQAVAVEEAVSKLTRSRIRNGFAPAIEANYRRHLGGAA